jgi:hypothetical protein
MKTLSSAQTLIMKIVFPFIWIIGFGFGTLCLWLGELHGKNGVAAPAFFKWQFLGIWIAGTLFIRWGCVGLKRVRRDSENLYVSNFMKEIAVPLNMIENVTENRWINIHPVTIHFRSTTEFGQKITFMPAMRFMSFWSSHPVVEELKRVSGGMVADAGNE